MNSQEQILPPPDSQQSARKWLVCFGELYSREINSALVSVWCRAVADIPDVQFNIACRHVMETFKPTSACPFPTPAHVREFLAVQSEAAQFALIEKSWDTINQKLNGYDYAKHPWTPQEEFAIRAAGGLNALREMTISDFQWAKKRFAEAWHRWNEMPEEAKALPSAEMSELIETHYHDAMQKFLTAPPQNVIHTIPRPAAVPLSDEAYERRRAELRIQAEKIKAAV